MAVSFNVTLGTLVGASRIALGWSQAELAKRTECSPQYINDIERGRREPKGRMIYALSEALNIPTEVIWFAVGKLPPDIVGDYSAERIKAAFGAMRTVLGT